MTRHLISRRQFLMLAASALAASGGRVRALQGTPPPDTTEEPFDWYADPPIVEDMRASLVNFIGDYKMALDFRCFNSDQDELFRIQINAYDLFPVASCFKAIAVLYYFLNVPQDEWEAESVTPLYRMAVYSDNVATGVVLDNVARRISGPGNAIEKFNDFLRYKVGLINGMHTWNWEGAPTRGLSDPRYAPSINTGRVVWKDDNYFQVDNVFSAADLSRAHDFITRGEFFTRSARFRAAARATKNLLSIPADNGYQSPIERIFPEGYTGKDGILPSNNLEIGRVVNDAGALQVNDHTYIIVLMAAGESESLVLDVLREVRSQMNLYEETGDGR